MDAFGKYVLTIISAAVIVGIIGRISNPKTSTGILIRMVCGLFLSFCVISPVADINFDAITAFAQKYQDDGDRAASYGESVAQDSLREIIKQETEAYILDKASRYDANLQVTVEVGQGNSPAPECAKLCGSISPYARKQLQQIMEDELGIPKENQQWIG